MIPIFLTVRVIYFFSQLIFIYSPSILVFFFSECCLSRIQSRFKTVRFTASAESRNVEFFQFPTEAAREDFGFFFFFPNVVYQESNQDSRRSGLRRHRNQEQLNSFSFLVEFGNVLCIRLFNSFMISLWKKIAEFRQAEVKSRGGN